MAVFRKNAVYTVDEAAERLRVHPNTIYRLCRSGRLAAYKMNGNRYRIPGSELEKLKWGPEKPGPKPKQKEGEQ